MFISGRASGEERVMVYIDRTGESRYDEVSFARWRAISRNFSEISKRRGRSRDGGGFSRDDSTRVIAIAKFETRRCSSNFADPHVPPVCLAEGPRLPLKLRAAEATRTTCASAPSVRVYSSSSSSSSSSRLSTTRRRSHARLGCSSTARARSVYIDTVLQRAARVCVRARASVFVRGTRATMFFVLTCGTLLRHT